MFDLIISSDSISVSTEQFQFIYNFDKRDYFSVQFHTFKQEFFIPSSCDSHNEKDLTEDQKSFSYYQNADYFRLKFEYDSNLWKKTYYIDIFENYICYYYELIGCHRINTLRYFEGIKSTNHIPHFHLTKHFNDGQSTPYRTYSTGSKANFSTVFNPEPNSYAKHLFNFYEYSQVSLNSDIDYEGGNFVFNPGILAYLLSEKTDEEWVTIGLGVVPGQYLFSEYEYLGGQTFGLNLNYWGVYEVQDSFKSPFLIIATGNSPYTALDGYIQILRDRNLIPDPVNQVEDWWHGPIICGWGHQCYQGDLFRVRSPRERQKDNSAYLLSTQAHYEYFIREIEKHKLDWQILIIDARWFISGGLMTIDIGRWPNMRQFVDDIHRLNKKVLLWWGPWETDGLGIEECICYFDINSEPNRNRPGRFSKFGGILDGKKLAPDITLPIVQQRLQKTLQYLLGSEPGCINIDGFKVDHVAATPGLYGLTFPEGSAKLYGIELLHFYHEFLYKTVKSIKPNALIIGQSPNPYFVDCIDMIRLGDIYSPFQRSISEEMKFRADMVKIANPNWLIDTDGWPMPSLEALAEYVNIQPQLGVPSLYYATHLDTTAEPIPDMLFAQIRNVWKSYISRELNNS